MNYYQTERSNAPVWSRGYEAQRQKGNNKTTIYNYNMDGKTSEKGSDAHGSMDEDTNDKVLEVIKIKMLEPKNQSSSSTGTAGN